MPAGWTRKRYVGSSLVRSSGILAFDTDGDRFQLRTPLSSQFAVQPTISFRTLYSVDVPASVLVTAWLTLQGYMAAAGGGDGTVSLTSPLGTDDAPSSAPLRSSAGYSNYTTVTEVHAVTQTAQVGLRSNHIYTRAHLGTIGWIDRRMAFTGYE